jgi:hypothetical protein
MPLPARNGLLVDPEVWPPAVSDSRLFRREARRRVEKALKGGAPWVGYLYVATALAVVVSQPPLPAAVAAALAVPVTWLCGLWIVPRGEDAYLATVAKLFWQCDIATVHLGHQLSAAIRDDEALLASLAEDASTAKPAKDGIVAGVRRLKEISAAVEKLNAQADSAGPPLDAAFKRVFSARLTAGREYLTVMERERQAVGALTPPPSLRGAQALILRVNDEVRAAMSGCVEAIEQQDDAAVDHWAAEVASALRERWDLRRDLAALLGSTHEYL